MTSVVDGVFGEWVAERFGEGAHRRLTRFAEDVLRFNRAQNLISRVDPAVQLRALVEECARVRAGVDVPGSWVDVGSGGGFPGLVWACLDPSQSLVLVERRRGRCDFLRREVAALGLEGVEVLEGAVESFPELRSRFALATAKAVRPVPDVFGLLAPLVEPQGRILVFHRAAWDVQGVPGEWLLDQRVPVAGGVESEGGPPEGYLFRRA